MADQDFSSVEVAVGVQVAFNTINGTIRDLGTTLALTNGVVLGDAESGDAESGISIPSIVGVYRDVAKVAASFTESADSFQKANVDGFSISFVMQGNGATSTPSVGEADLSAIMPGVEAIFESAGLVGTTGGAGGEQDYNPLATANVYTTWKLWHGDLSMVFSDCLVESLVFEATPGGFVVATANVKVGAMDTALIVDGVGARTVNYGIMASQAGPVVEGVAFAAFGTTRGFENLTVTIASEVAEFGDSNVVTTGVRQAMTRRVISVNGTLYVDDTPSNAAIANLVNANAPTADLSFQVGTPSDDPYNAFKIEVNNLQAKSIKYNRIGTTLVVELNDSKATSTTAGTEFQLTMN